MEGATAISSNDWKPVIEAMTAQLNVGTVVEVLGVIVAAGIGFTFLWWGVRKASKSLITAVKSGKLRL